MSTFEIKPNNNEKKKSRLIEVPMQGVQDYLKSSRDFYAMLGVELENATYDEELKELRFEAFLPNTLQAYNGLIHGGAILSLLDSSCGVVALIEASRENKKALTKKLSTDFKNPMIPSKKYICVGKIDSKDEKYFYTVGHIEDEEGKIYATAEVK